MEPVAKKPTIALVLSSGGARGYAHIGAIEELQSRGYHISSIAGCSMGALVGGIYALGKLDVFHRWLLGLNMKKIFGLTDFSVSLSHWIKGEKIINALAEFAPDCKIEDLALPYCAIATDLKAQREVVFDKGSLYAAIRASIAMPTYFSPLRTKSMLLVDGGISNPLPLNRVKRTPGDLLVAINASAPFDESYERRRMKALNQKSAQNGLLNLRESLGFGASNDAEHSDRSNYVSLIADSIHTLIQQHSNLQMKLTPPDVLVSIPINRFVGFSYDKPRKIIHYGRRLMKKALDDYEAKAK